MSGAGGRPVVHVAAGSGDAHALLLRLAEEVTGARYRVAHSCRQCGSSRHGVPRLVGEGRRLSASLARSGERRGERAVVALCEDAAVGVDLEQGSVAFPGFDEVALHPLERCRDDAARTRAWVRKEAVLKAMGTGLADDPRTVRLADDGAVLAGPEVRLADVDLTGVLGAGWTCAVAVRGREAPEVVLR